MFIQVHKVDKVTKNAGSSKQIINYLEKENQNLSIEDQIHFFNHDEENISSVKAFMSLDSNIKGLKANDSKFYMLTINPSEKELKHLNNDPEKLKEYTKNVMDEYAKMFQRTIDGRPMNGNDLLYFAKIEHTRSYDPKDKLFQEQFKHNYEIRNQIYSKENELKHDIFTPKEADKIKQEIATLEGKYIRDREQNVILPGETKPGLNTHIHVVVSRKDKQMKVALSPFATSKGSKNTLNGKKVQIGFDRKEFVQKCEKNFDKTFDYLRPVKETFQHKYEQKNGLNVKSLVNIPTNERELAKRLVLEVFDKDKHIQRLVSPVTNVPKSGEQLLDKIQQRAIDSLTKLIAGGTNPTVSVVKTVIEKSINFSVSQGLSL